MQVLSALMTGCIENKREVYINQKGDSRASQKTLYKNALSVARLKELIIEIGVQEMRKRINSVEYLELLFWSVLQRSLRN